MGNIKTKKELLGKKLAGGDFNDIIGPKDKQGGKPRVVHSFQPFRDFIQDMGMVELVFQGRKWT